MSALRRSDYRTGEVTLEPLMADAPPAEPTSPVSRRWLTEAEVAAIRERDAREPMAMLPVRGIYTDAERIARQIVREALG